MKSNRTCKDAITRKPKTRSGGVVCRKKAQMNQTQNQQKVILREWYRRQTTRKDVYGLIPGACQKADSSSILGHKHSDLKHHRKSIRDDPGDPDLIARIPKYERGKTKCLHQSDANAVTGHLRPWPALKMKGALSQGTQVASRSWKMQEHGLSPRTSRKKKHSPADTLTSA